MGASELKEEPLSKSKLILRVKVFRGKEMSLSGDLGLYYKWPKSDPNAVFELPMRPKCSF